MRNAGRVIRWVWAMAFVAAVALRLTWAWVNTRWAYSLSNLAFALFLLTPAFTAIAGGDALLHLVQVMGRMGRKIAATDHWDDVQTDWKVYIYLLVAIMAVLGALMLLEGLQGVLEGP